MKTDQMAFDRQVVKIKTKGDFMSRFLLLVCLCTLGFLASCKSLCKPKEEPNATSIVVPEEESNVASTVTTAPDAEPCSFEPAPTSKSTCCTVEPLPRTAAPEITPAVEVRPEPEVQPQAAKSLCCEEAHRLGFWQGAVAASLFMFVVSTILCWYSYRQYQKLKPLHL